MPKNKNDAYVRELTNLLHKAEFQLDLLNFMDLQYLEYLVKVDTYKEVLELYHKIKT